MKNLCAFNIFFLLLKFSLTLCGLIEPVCFWRIKNSEENDGDSKIDCAFSIFAVEGPVEDYFYGKTIGFR